MPSEPTASPEQLDARAAEQLTAFAEIDAAMREAVGRGIPPRPDLNPQRQQITRVHYTYEDCIDRILREPTIATSALAAIYGRSPAWMSIVINSDMFQARLAQRREELVDPVLREGVETRFKAVANRSLEVLLEKLHQPAHQVSDQLALQAARLGKDALGVGNAPPPAAPSGNGLAELAERLVGFVRKPPEPAEIIDVTTREVKAA